MDSPHDALFELASDLLAVMEPDGRFLRLNPAWQTCLGWSVDELLGTSALALIHPEDAERARDALDRLRDGEVVTGVDLRLRTRTGSHRAIQFNGARSAVDGCFHGVGRDVTEARSTERLLRLVEDATQVGSFEIDLDTSLVRWSRVTHEIYGTDPDTYTPTVADALTCYPPEALAVLEPALERLMAYGEPYDLTTPFVGRDGRRRWVRARAQAEIRHGRIVAAYGTFEDVTEAREEHLRLARFREMVELGQDGVWEVTPDGITTYVNERMAQLLETTVDELLGTPILDHVDPAWVEHGRQKLRERRTGVADTYEICLRTRTGAPLWVNISARPRHDAEGGIVAITAMISDLTALKAKEQQLRRSEARLRAFVEHAPLGIVVHDWESGALIDANRAASAIAGLPVEAMRGRPYTELLELAPSADLAASSDAEASGSYGPIEVGFVRPDGQRVTLEASGIRLPTDEGRQAVWSLIHDVTERRRLEQLKAEFVATVSHELRTPLTSILGALALLAERTELDAEGRHQLLDMAQRNGVRLERLIDDILDLSRYDTIPAGLELQPHDLGVVAQASVAAAAAAAEQAGVELRVVRRGAQPAIVWCDERRLLQAVGNLLTNALSFAPAGTVVEVDVEVVGRWAQLSVRDHGPGVPEWFEPRLFERFAQADSSDRRRVGGTGLGLSIVRAVVEHHGGDVGYDRPDGGGARFTLGLPLVVEPDPAGA